MIKNPRKLICVILLFTLTVLFFISFAFRRKTAEELYKNIPSMKLTSVYLQWGTEELYCLSKPERQEFIQLISEIELGEKISDEHIYLNYDRSSFVLKQFPTQKMELIFDRRIVSINGELFYLSNQSDDRLENFEDAIIEKHNLQKVSDKDMYNALTLSEIKNIYLQYGGKKPHLLSIEEKREFFQLMKAITLGDQIPDEEIHIGGGWTHFIIELSSGNFILLSADSSKITINNVRYRADEKHSENLAVFEQELYSKYNLKDQIELSPFIY